MSARHVCNHAGATSIPQPSDHSIVCWQGGPGSEICVRLTASSLSATVRSAPMHAAVLQLTTSDVVVNCHEVSRSDSSLFSAPSLVPAVRHLDLLLIHFAASVFAAGQRSAMHQPVDWHLGIDLWPSWTQIAVDAAYVPLQLTLRAVSALQMIMTDIVKAVQVQQVSAQPAVRVQQPDRHQEQLLQSTVLVMQQILQDDLRCGLFETLPNATQSPGDASCQPVRLPLVSSRF